MFITINPDEEHFNIFKTINEIHRHIKKLKHIKKTVRTRELESNHSIITNALIRVAKKVLPSL